MPKFDVSIVPDSITHIQKAREKNTIFSAIFYIDFDTNRLFQIYGKQKISFWHLRGSILLFEENSGV